MITVEIKYSPSCLDTDHIRRLFCNETYETRELKYDPLHETNFNELLARIAQTAFDKGRAFNLDNHK